MPTEWTPLPLSPAQVKSSPNSLLETRTGSKRICIAFHQEKWHAFDARCPHAGGPFADGFIDSEGKVICPWHRFAFDLKTGQCDSGGYFIDAYPIRESEGRLWIQVKPRKPWWKLW